MSGGNLIKESTYKTRARILRHMSLLAVDLRRKFTTNDKRVISRLWNKYNVVARNILEYKTVIVSKRIASEIYVDKLRVLLPNGKVKLFIKAGPESGVQIRMEKLGPYKFPVVVITSRMFDEIIYPAGRHIFTIAKLLFDRKTPDETILVRISGFAHFSKAFTSFRIFENYLTKWMPSDEDADREELIDYISIVKVRGDWVDARYSASTERGSKIARARRWQKREGKF
jgi:hypothetical protein